MTDDAEITFENATFFLKRKGQSDRITATVLAVEVVGAQRIIYLDSLVHEPYEKTLADFQVEGAVSTILSQPYRAS